MAESSSSSLSTGTNTRGASPGENRSTSTPNEKYSRSNDDKLSQLRALAQSHLTTIASEDRDENLRLRQVEADIQRYTKVSHRKRKAKSPRPTPSFGDDDNNKNKNKNKSHGNGTTAATKNEESSSSSSPPPETKGPRLRPAQDVLDRLRWDENVSQLSDYVIGYVERFEGVMEMNAENWIRDSTDEDWIPQHRIRYIKQRRRRQCGQGNGEVEESVIVWSRDERINRIFGSGSSVRGAWIKDGGRDASEADNADRVGEVDAVSEDGGGVVL